MPSWITSTGFNRKTLQEMRLILEDGFRAIYGPGTDVSPLSPNGQLISLLSLALSTCNEGGQEIWSSLDPASAVDAALDMVCALTGVTRLNKAPGTAACLLYAENASLGTVVASGKQVRRVRGGLVYSLIDPVTISLSACREVYLRQSSEWGPGEAIELVTSFGTFSATTPATDIAYRTYDDLATQINASGWGGVAVAYPPEYTPPGALLSGVATLWLYDYTVDFNLSLGTSFVAPLTGSNGNFLCSVAGYETAAAGEISEIVTPVAGWTQVYNRVAASPGRDEESNEALRIRRLQSFKMGYATDNAIRLNLLNRVPGIVSAQVTSNRKKVYDSTGRPPNCFEAVVDGGLNEDVAAIIWDAMPSGIEPYGNIHVIHVDSQGFPQDIYFSRPLYKYLHIRVVYYLGESGFPIDGEAAMAQAILDWSLGEYKVDQDVIPNKILTPVYTIPGVGVANAWVAFTENPGDIPSFVDTPLAVDGRSIAQAALNRISFQRL